MSLVSETRGAIDVLIRSLEIYGLEWVSDKEITNIKPTQINKVYNAIAFPDPITLVLLGSSEECTPTLLSAFARIYSLPIRALKRNNNGNNFKRYKRWLHRRNESIIGFTKHDDKYYMVASSHFYHYHCRYGFCSECGILRCSPVWCVCGHQQLSDGWSSNNKQLDAFIKKTQLQTNSPNQAYWEWIPFDCIDEDLGDVFLDGLPTRESMKLVPLETDDLYDNRLCDKHPDILSTDIWAPTIGFTYCRGKYWLIETRFNNELCLACTRHLEPNIYAFCFECKSPSPPDWTTGNKSLDAFIMESWCHTINVYDAYIQSIAYCYLANVQQMTSLRHGCTHMAYWLEPTTNKWASVILKKIAIEQKDQELFDFHRLTEEYPTILTPENIWVTGITWEPSTREYYLVFYYDARPILDILMQHIGHLKYMRYSDFYELKETGSDCYGTVYAAKYRNFSELWRGPEIITLKRFKRFDQARDLFISEFRNYAKCITPAYDSFLFLYGYTQDPETQEYMIVMQYANNGSLSSYLDQNINKLTWKKKMEYLMDIAHNLKLIHDIELVHCDLHGGNILFHDADNASDFRSYICGLGLSQSVNSNERNSTIRGVLPFVAPEVFRTRKFTRKSDIYSFGIIVYLMATGEPPFRDRQFDGDLMCDIMRGLRPSMPDSAPEEYKSLAEMCCDADPDERPADGDQLWTSLCILIKEMDLFKSDDSVWNAIYHHDVKPLSHLEKECKYSSKILLTGDSSKTTNT